MKKILIILLIQTLPAICLAQSGWKDLFNGQNLTGWTQYGGKAEFVVQNGILIGKAVPNSPNSFLAANVHYNDFILEVEFKVDPKLNSGIQIRSHVNPQGRMVGYQVEIDPSERSWTGGIYDEARRGWMYPLDDNQPARNSFKQQEWNTMRVEAVGSSIRTWVNGVPAARMLDNETAEGLIALQVHSIRNPEDAGIQIAFRKIRIMTDNLEAHLTSDSELTEFNFIPNTLSDFEKSQGWQLLWDGKTSNGWRSARSEKFPEFGWKIENGVLKVEKSGGGEAAHGGDIITVKQYKDFELIVDFNITEGANSGIKYFVNPKLNPAHGSSIGCEFQILDDQRHPDAKMGVKGNRTLASLYDLIPATNKRFRGPGVWSRARIVVKGNDVEHWLNGIKVLEYQRGTPQWRALVDSSKFAPIPDFGNAEYGHILLQDHGDEVSFSSIKIKEL